MSHLHPNPFFLLNMPSNVKYQQLSLFSDDEEWRDVVGYEGLYQVSNKGRVRSLNYRQKNETHIIRLCLNNKGYLMAGLTKDGHLKTIVVHRLVAKAFIPNPNKLPQINHKDEVKTNNTVDNLEWCTNKYNHDYGTHNERVGLSNTGKKRSQESIKNYKKCQDYKRDNYAKRILQYDLNGILIKEWRCAFDIEKDLGLSQNNIRTCCNYKAKTCGGFIWRYRTEIIPSVVHQVNNETMRPVLQYDLDANYINEYPSINEAGRKTGILSQHIGKCCKGERKSAGKYIWKFKDDSREVKPYHSRNSKGETHHNAKAVLQLSINGEYIKEWGCISVASNELGINVNSICGCCRKRNKTAGGFVWRYKRGVDDILLENT